MKTAAAYIRVSDERQDEFSPDSQLKLIREYCKKNEIELPDELIFYDDGISAKSTKKRKQFNDMIALAKLKDKPFQMILVWKFSRFARNQEESIVYKSLLRKNGVEVISISEPLSDNPFGGLIERIIEWMDEYYLIRLSDEVRRGMTERATRGLPNVAPPYGYRMIDGKYVIQEEEAAIVRSIFEMFVDGQKIRPIVLYLQNLEIKNQKGNFFDNRGIEYILCNPCYIGYLRYNPHGRSASKRNFNNPDDIITKGTHEPIVSKELFNKAQLKMAERKKAYPKYARENIKGEIYALKGMVKCNNCGSTLVLQKANNGLQCYSYARGICKVSHHINLTILNKMIIDAMKDAVMNLSFNIASENLPSSSPIDYDAMIRAEERKLERAKQAYQEGADSLEEYKITKAKIQNQIEKLKKQKTKALVENQSIDLKQFAKTVSYVIEIMENPEASEELKNKALRSIINKIVFYKPDRRIELFFYV